MRRRAFQYNRVLPAALAPPLNAHEQFMKKYLSIAALLAFASAGALAQVSVTAPWVRATVPAQKSTGAFMHLQSPTAARLVGVSSDVAGTVELHQMEMSGDVMKMKQVESIDLPAGKGVNLASGGYHIMLVGLKRRLREGEAVELTLVLEHPNKKRERMTVKVPVKPLAFAGPAAGHMTH